MKIAVIIPPYVVQNGRAIRPNKAMLPVGALAMAGILGRGHEVTVYDYVFQEDWLPGLKAIRADMVFVACHTVRNIIPVRIVVDSLRRSLGPSTPIYLGGPLTTELDTAAFHKLDIPITGVICGYGHGLVADELTSGRTGDHRAQLTASLPNVVLNYLSQATRAAYRHASDGKYPLVGHGFGCQWACSYCAAKMAAPWKERSLAEVIVEIDQAKDDGYMHLWCIDNLLLVNPERTLVFDRLVAERGMTWSGMTRSELVSKHGQMLQGLSALTSLALGVESASKDRLQAVRRGQHTSPIDAFGWLAHKRPDLERVAFAILDWPQSTLEDFWKLYRILEACRPSSISWSFYNPPAAEILRGRQPDEYGFYRWPFGLSGMPSYRVVQQAMILAGRWWRGWQLEHAKPFFANQRGFGVRFAEGNLYQPHAARSAIGDIWEVWQERS
jgi:radical SAM superfamily enzyme YgiQ (UPF0313 family)